MHDTRTRRPFDLLAIGLVGACVAGLYGAAVPDLVASLTGSTVQGRIASRVIGHVPSAPIARVLGIPEKPPAPVADSVPTERPETQALTVQRRLDVDTVHALYGDLGYALDAVRTGGEAVPRVFLASVPHGIDGLTDVDQRKSLFLRTMLPLVLKVNEDIAADRDRLQQIADRAAEGKALRVTDRRFLEAKGREYGVKSPDAKKLLARVDVIPPSLALAQAAEESGWGTSRFARQGNALFGQWTTGLENGMVPRNREDGATHVIKAFPTLLGAVRAYVRNLNTHRAYAEFRARREQMRRDGQPLDGYTLAQTLHRYSERGSDYIDTLHVIMRANDLSAFDAAQLSMAPVEVASLEGVVGRLR